MRCSSLLIANVVAVLAHSPHDVVSALAASSSGRFLFVCLRARFYRSSDGGDNWEVADRGLPTAHDMSDERQLHVQVELSPDFERDATAHVLLSSTNTDQIPPEAGGIFRSTDGGRRWSRLEHSLNPGVSLLWITMLATQRALFVSACDPDHCHLLRSLDGASLEAMMSSAKALEWTSDKESDSASAVRTDGRDPIVSIVSTGLGVLAASHAGAIRSTDDDGSTWQTVVGAKDGPNGILWGACDAEVGTRTWPPGGHPHLSCRELLRSLRRWAALLQRSASRVTAVLAAGSDLLVVSCSAGLARSQTQCSADLCHSSYARLGGLAMLADASSVAARLAPNGTFIDSLYAVGVAVWRVDEVEWSCTSAIRHTRHVRLSSPTPEGGIYSGGTIGATQLPTNVQANEFPEEQNFTSVVLPSGESSTVLVGAFTGLWRSRDGGRTFTHCDVISSQFTMLAVAPVRDNRAGAVTLVACSYRTGCVGGELDLSGRSMMQELNPAEKGCGYHVVAFSPAYAFDGVVMATCHSVPGVMRSADWLQSWSLVKLPPLDLRPIPAVGQLPKGSVVTVHSIAFSPNFASDRMIFCAGYNLGVVKSTDGGTTWQTVWTAGGSYSLRSLDLVISPEFARDATIVAYRRERSPIVNERNSTIHLSRDGGSTWLVIGQPGRYWKNAVLVRHGGGLAVLASTMPKFGPDPGCNSVSVLALSSATGSIKANNGWRELRYHVGETSVSACAVSYPLKSGFGRPIAFSPQDDQATFTEPTVVLPWRVGGVLVGRLHLEDAGPSSAPLTRAELRSVALQSDTADSEEPFSAVLTSEPPSDQRRSTGNDLLQFSPSFARDQTLFAASFHSILTSPDGGATWRVVHRINHTLIGRSACGSSSGSALADCELCQNTEPRTCLRCTSGRMPSVHGRCPEPEAAEQVAKPALPEPEPNADTLTRVPCDAVGAAETTDKLPAVILIGSPRTSTSSISMWLRQGALPGVCAYHPGEPDVFSHIALKRLSTGAAVQRYVHGFASCKEDDILFEKSPWYIQTPGAPAAAVCFLPPPIRDALRIIAVLRHPVKRSMSFFNLVCTMGFRSAGLCNASSFGIELHRTLALAPDSCPDMLAQHASGDAWEACVRRFWRGNLLLSGLYAPQLSSWMGRLAMPRSRLLVLSFEELHGKMESEVLSRLGSFMLGRPFQTKGQLPHVNAGSHYNGTTAHLSCAMLPQLEAFFAPFLVALRDVLFTSGSKPREEPEWDPIDMSLAGWWPAEAAVLSQQECTRHRTSRSRLS